jgi:hypothetical protein
MINGVLFMSEIIFSLLILFVGLYAITKIRI